MQGKITKTAVDKLEPWTVLWDSEVNGFGVRRHGAEAKHYLLRYRFGGKQTFRKIGRHGSPFTPDTARTSACGRRKGVAEMNDLVRSSVPAPPADITLPSELPARINDTHEKVKQSLQRGAEHAIEAGRLLLQAKATVRHGNWLEWVGANCKFSERTAQLYMRLAEERPLLESKPQRIADLTITDAIKLLEPLKSPEESAPRISSPSRRGKKRDPVADAIKTDPLAILGRAWDAAVDHERQIFKKQIGATT